MRILITGSSEGLGLLCARALVTANHTVFAHARNETRAGSTRAALPGAAAILVADLSTFAGIRSLAEQIKQLSNDARKVQGSDTLTRSDESSAGALDCIIHNAGLSCGPFAPTDSGYPAVFMVNVAAPYMLTCLCAGENLPRRLVYVTSEVRAGADGRVGDDFGWRGESKSEDWEPKDGQYNQGRNYQAYATTKLWNSMFAGYFARVLAGKGVMANAVDPGWVATRMGGAYATGDLDAAVRTYVMLALGSGESEGKTGKTWHEQIVQSEMNESALDVEMQRALVRKLEEVTGVQLP